MSRLDKTDVKIENSGIVKRLEADKVEVQVTVNPIKITIELDIYQYISLADVDPDTMDKLLETSFDVIDAEIMSMRKAAQDKQSQKEEK